ncbi:4-hydroxythreonine-4-phosphate dehydrogenase PdxA [Testudinibacter sp. TR-2022]|uniref:4-hydroxythreonine-4-phosphate dehydrogenase PdxA n=1 Tax=Testudinibacter sp. TR-2022 TaxID=2585029 RepID=UPI001117BCEA|nr:4-hydroxythreonine-4-phosphate dehydrogenase PdxA [Testudinibacter sp. TR-2022]TNH03253.1 4-hydroxythreonine-4-phosphate dehydrogenase PdxA [Pasteurellaceae bacterium Phil31]TNH10920.1 4-hydroxythreonine-4-phosphate dehydrogenase PdxA [Testudinibacter sp. TR-2022]TNH12287.1 4-hydroxythreonine-4-phosphate dehydrogenase PdxA [Testudinibacter sp. TR-2022]TNH15025.1 4-hydroxythreonine-4-phosphate dehydrogenase PdxA [Testudinibacter sp. TR-2022]TNH20500.1 4-hydroxythreonine-4-phosphate dehydroge
MSLPILAVTMGDIAGIGPEITVKTLLAHADLRRKAKLFVIGDYTALANACMLSGFSASQIKLVTDLSCLNNDSNEIELLQIADPLPAVQAGKISAVAGDSAYRFVVEACKLGREGKIDGIVTAPLNKEAMHAGGHHWPGHTEILAHEFGVKDYSMILSSGDFYLFHLTTHQSLHSAIDACTTTRTTTVINLAFALAKSLNKPSAKIGVCGINPHAGENRLFGDEDLDQLAPAIQLAQRQGINIQGPLPADALIPQAVRGKWDIVIACYHDQGHAPFKAVYGDDGVNITAGLPIVRVSVDHGTAFDIAGKGIARENSLVLACERAAELAPGWHLVWNSLSS